jgi:glycosyltransferase involved in cell wall biosynthesis
VKQTDPGVHLHIAGDGPLRAPLADQARALGLAASVTFHGHVERRELAAYYRGADVVAVSSRHEAQLVVALEAALCGTPIVGTAVGLVADFAPKAARAVPVGDDGELAAAIVAAARSETGQALARAARQVVGSEYLAVHTAEQLMSLYRHPARMEWEASRDAWSPEPKRHHPD